MKDNLFMVFWKTGQTDEFYAYTKKELLEKIEAKYPNVSKIVDLKDAIDHVEVYSYLFNRFERDEMNF